MNKMWTDTDSKYLIIGGGPSGLSCAKNFIDHGVPFYAVEASEDIGGIWNIMNERSAIYESAHTISSKSNTEFADFPIKHQADYPSHYVMKEYLDDYTSFYKLKRHYLLGVEVLNVKKNGHGWLVQLKNESEYLFKGLILASGLYHTAYKPSFKGNFNGEIIHSFYYKNPDLFKDKKVLIVGGGNSACDIAVDAVVSAKSVSWSTRRGYHYLPKFLFGIPTDVVGERLKVPVFVKRFVSRLLTKISIGKPESYGLKKPDHKLFEIHPVLNSLILHHIRHGEINPMVNVKKLSGDFVVFEDGTKERFDLILLATGYKIEYPYIDNAYLNWNNELPSLFLNIFHPTDDSLFIAGLIESAGIGWEGKNKQGELIALYILNKEKNSPGYKKMNQFKKNGRTEINGSINYKKLRRMGYYVNKKSYLKQLLKWSKVLRL